MTTISYINNVLGGIQHRTKNRIMHYINSDDYFGNEYLDWANDTTSGEEGGWGNYGE